MRLICGLTLALALCGPLFPAALTADEPAASPEATLKLTIEGEIGPEMAPAVGRLSRLYFECYPKLLKDFDNPDRPASRSIKLVMERRLRVPAYCRGSEIHISNKWLLDNPDDVALLTHELTHAVQAYPKGEPGWLIEGLADYARHVYGPADQPGWSLPAKLTAQNKYTDSYRVTGRFLLWLEEQHKGAVNRIHRALQAGEYSDDIFKSLTEKSLETLWDECVADLANTGPERN